MYNKNPKSGLMVFAEINFFPYTKKLPGDFCIRYDAENIFFQKSYRGLQNPYKKRNTKMSLLALNWIYYFIRDKKRVCHYCLKNKEKNYLMPE